MELTRRRNEGATETIAEALRRGARLLEREGIQAARLTAEVLLSHVLTWERSRLYSHPERRLSGEERSRFAESLRRRLEGTPTQYITGVQEFYGRRFCVTPEVMIPRPETEHVVETALELSRGAERVLEVGCGSGAIAVTLQLETGSETLATDVSLPALRVAAANARALGAKLCLVACDVAAAIADASVDLLVSNPPYVPRAERDHLQREVRDYEPAVALFGGADGLEFYRRMAGEARRVLRPGGWLVMEMGIRQLGPIQQMLGACWGQKRVVPDLAGLPRVLATRYLP